MHIVYSFSACVYACAPMNVYSPFTKYINAHPHQCFAIFPDLSTVCHAVAPHKKNSTAIHC